MVGPCAVPLSCRKRFFCKQAKIEAGSIRYPFKFELGSLAKELECTLGILDTRQLDYNLCLSLADNYRFCHTKLINPVTDNLKGLFHCVGSNKIDFRVFQRYCDFRKGSFLGIHLYIDFSKAVLNHPVHCINSTGVGQGKENSSRLRFCPYCTYALFPEAVFQFSCSKFKGVCFSLVQIDLKNKMHATLEIKTKA